MTASPALPGSHDIDADELLELELQEVTAGDDQKTPLVMAVGGLGAILVVYALFSVITGGPGIVPLVLLLAGLAALLVAYRTISTADSGGLADLRSRLGSHGRGGSVPKPSVRRVGDLFDI